MPHVLPIIVLTVTGGVLVIAGLLFFLRPRWLLDWLKGMAVFGLILVGLYSLVLAVNLAAYQPLEGMQTVAIISTEREAEQIWRVTLQIEGSASNERTLRGDQWQMDARIIRFTGPVRWLGTAAAYRLESLSGRYTSLEQERSVPRTVIGLSEKPRADLWQLDRKFNLPFVEGVSGNATFMPMRDGATFDVRISTSRLVAVPVNDQARAAVQFWDH